MTLHVNGVVCIYLEDNQGHVSNRITTFSVVVIIQPNSLVEEAHTRCHPHLHLHRAHLHLTHDPLDKRQGALRVVDASLVRQGEDDVERVASGASWEQCDRGIV